MLPIVLPGLALALAGLTLPASAQISAAGPANNLASAFVRGNDVAYDAAHDVYLAVGGSGQALWGRFVDASGAPVAAAFRIDGGDHHVHFPRVAAGRDGRFLATWHQTDLADGGTRVHARVVSYPAAGPAAPDVTLSDSGGWWESGAAVAYSRTSNRFLVAWQAVGTPQGILGRLVGDDGQAIGNQTQIWGPTLYGRDPGVAWNPDADEFGVSFCGFDGVAAVAAFARVDMKGSVLRRTIFDHSGGSFISDVAYNSATKRYLVVWHAGGTKGAELAANGDALAAGAIGVGTYDGLGVSYNPVSGTFLVVGHGNGGEVFGAELNARGAPITAAAALTASGTTKGSFYPRPAASTKAARWAVSYGFEMGQLRDQIVQTATTRGGSAAALGAPPQTFPIPVDKPPPPPPPPRATLAYHPARGASPLQVSATLTVTSGNGTVNAIRWLKNGAIEGPNDTNTHTFSFTAGGTIGVRMAGPGGSVELGPYPVTVSGK